MKKYLPLLVLTGILITTSSYTKEKPSAVAKELYFPVTGNKSNIGSLWGAERDGGKRTHEGIDIFSPKGTPVVAISDGYIQSAGVDQLGGNTITLQPDDYEWEAYYAHLDVQYVKSGQRVKKGQLIGTVGNTGNAKTTPPHLHFGIYTPSGAIDPLPYVQTSPKITTPVAADKEVIIAKAPAKKTSAPSTSKQRPRNREVEAAVKNVAVKVIAGELMKRIKIRI